MTFLPGNTHGKGRPKGSRNRFSADFWSDLYAEWQEYGPVTLRAARETDPVEFCKMVARLCVIRREPPTEPLKGQTTAELIAQLERMGYQITPPMKRQA